MTILLKYILTHLVCSQSSDPPQIALKEQTGRETLNSGTSLGLMNHPIPGFGIVILVEWVGTVCLRNHMRPVSDKSDGICIRCPAVCSRLQGQRSMRRVGLGALG